MKMKPNTPQEALQNAIHAAEEATTHAKVARTPNPQAWAAVSRAWSDIAFSMPETRVAIDNLSQVGQMIMEPDITAEEWETIRALRVGEVKVIPTSAGLRTERLVAGRRTRGPVSVSPVLYDVLKAVATTLTQGRPLNVTQEQVEKARDYQVHVSFDSRAEHWKVTAIQLEDEDED